MLFVGVRRLLWSCVAFFCLRCCRLLFVVFGFLFVDVVCCVLLVVVRHCCCCLCCVVCSLRVVRCSLFGVR